MKDLLSKENYCYKIHKFILMEISAYPPYRHLYTTFPIWITHSFLQENLEPLPPISHIALAFSLLTWVNPSWVLDCCDMGKSFSSFSFVAKRSYNQNILIRIY